MLAVLPRKFYLAAPKRGGQKKKGGHFQGIFSHGFLHNETHTHTHPNTQTQTHTAHTPTHTPDHLQSQATRSAASFAAEFRNPSCPPEVVARRKLVLSLAARAENARWHARQHNRLRHPSASRSRPRRENFNFGETWGKGVAATNDNRILSEVVAKLKGWPENWSLG